MATNPHNPQTNYLAWEIWENQNQQAQQAEQQRIREYTQAFQNAGLTNQSAPNMTEYQQALDNLIKQQEEFQNRVTGYQDAGGRRFEGANVEYDAQGRPKIQDFESTRNADGSLMDQYRLNAGGPVEANRDALDSMRNQALAEGDSPWAKMMLEKQQVEQAQAADQARRSTANQQVQAQGLLAQTGGLNGAGRISLARNAMRQGAAANQNVNRQGLLDRLSIGVQDQQNKNSMLGQIQQGEMNMANLGMQNRQYQTGVDQANIEAQMKDLEQRRMYDANNYNQAMQAWGADKSANAQAAAARSSGGGKK